MNAGREFLQTLFRSAVAAAAPEQVLPAALPADTRQPARVIGAGKAAAAMARVLDRCWQGELQGLVVTRYGHGEKAGRIEVLEAAHPVPDAAGLLAGQRMLEIATAAGEQELLLCLLSGGASALLSVPPPGIDHAQKASLTTALLRSGATISEINCVRKHLSLVKGGRLAQAAWPARLLCLAISDVPGDDPAVIGSGPCVADPSTSQQAIEILARYHIEVSPAVQAWLRDPRSETAKDGDPRLQRATLQLIATPALALAEAESLARAQGIEVQMLGSALQGEARELAQTHAQLALQYLRTSRRCLLLSGGETSVTVRGNGRGGRNTEYLLALFAALGGARGVTALAADTDGIDGSEDNAGAWFDDNTVMLARARQLEPAQFLECNNSHRFFATLGTLLYTGPTRTNVNDFRAILLDPGAV